MIEPNLKDCARLKRLIDEQMNVARQGIRWWEVDMTYYSLRLLATVGVVRDIRERKPAAKRLPLEAADAVPGPAPTPVS